MTAHRIRRHSLLLLALLLLAALLPGLPTTPRAQAFANGQVASLALGQGVFTANELMGPKRLSASADIAIDPVTGRVIVVDHGNNRVLIYGSFASLGNGVAALFVLGQPDFFSISPGSGPQRMHHPTGLAIVNNQLWVADRDNNRILRFDNLSSIASNGISASGVLGQPDLTSNAASTTAQGLTGPVDVSAGQGGTIWVADTFNHRVLRFPSTAGSTNGVAADKVLGQPNFISNAVATTAQGVSKPHRVELDTNGRLWVADTGNHRVLRFDNAAAKPNGAAADGVLGQPNFITTTLGTSAQMMNGPSGLSADTSGRLWVTEPANYRALRFDDAASKPNGAAADGVLGQPNFDSNNYGRTPQGLTDPFGILIDSATGRLWIADHSSNRAVWHNNAASKPNGAAADGALGQHQLDSRWYVDSDKFYIPSGVTVDPATGKVFVVDTGNHRVLRFASRASLSNGIGAEAVFGQLDVYSYFGETGAQRVRYPSGATVDGQGRLWVADQSNHRVLRFDNAASKPSGAPADGVLGQANFTSATPATSAQGMLNPSEVAVDSTGRLWVADQGNHRVLRFDNAASKPNGAAADAVLGQTNFTSASSTTTAQGMRSPSGIAVDSAGRLWVADQGNHRVLRFDNAAAQTSGSAANSVLGQPNFTSATSAATATGMSSPSDVAVDGGGRLWVSDTNNNRTLWFNTAAGQPSGAAASGVIGQPGFGTRGSGTTAQTLSQPRGLALDPSGGLWVADRINNRVLLFNDLAAAGVLVRLPSQSGAPGAIVQIPILIDQPVNDLISASMTVSFNSAVLQPHGAAALDGALTPGWTVAANSNVAGQLSLALISSGPSANGTGVLARLEFLVVGASGASTPLTLSAVSLNEGSIPATTQNGSFTVNPAGHQLTVRAINAITSAPLPNTSVQASGPASTSCNTSNAGDCPLPGLPAGNYTLALTKNDGVSGINAYDAALILQHATGQRTLTGPAFTAGDTNGNGQVTAYDAALVLQYVARGLILPFPVGVIWKFAPPNPVLLNANQLVTVPGVLIGDVSSYVALAAARLRSAGPEPAGALQLIQRGKPDALGFRTVELWLEPADQDLLCLEATLEFDPALVTDLRVAAGPSTGALFAASTTPDGKLRVALASAKALPGGTAVTLRYRSDEANGLTLVEAETNQGGAPAWLPPTAQDWQLRTPLVRR